MTIKPSSKAITIIILGGLVFASSKGESISQDQNDFRYVAYNDLLTTSNRYHDQNVTNFSRLFFDVNKNIIVAGARDYLLKFSMQLDLKLKVKWEATKSFVDTCLQKGQNDCRNYIMVIHRFNNELLVCGNFAYSPHCSWRDINTLDVIRSEKSIGKSPFNPRTNFTTIVVDGEMFVGSTIDFSGADPVILRTDLKNVDQDIHSKTLRTKQYNDLELFDPQFVGSFEYADFVYFIFREVSIEVSSYGGKAIYSRIARVCKKDNGGTHFFKDNWSSFLKARLNCSLPGGDFPFYFDEVQAISYSSDDKELYATFTTPENSIHGSAICVFNMSSIENAFNGPIKYQASPGSPVWHQRNLESRSSYDCKFDQKSSNSLLDSSKYSLLERSVQPNSNKPMFTTKLEKLSHIAVTKIPTKLHENVNVIFVANEQGFIKKLSILPRTKESCVIEILEPENFESRIETMQYHKSTQSLYIGMASSLLQVRAERCSRHISKISCLNSMDPFCGWNDLALACTSAPNNDPLMQYWYQNSTICPILTVPVDGAFSAWSKWSKCAKNDNDVSLTVDNLNSQDYCLCRTRKCDNPAPKYGGKECEGSTIEVANCTVHGDWSEWSSWSQCSQSCGVAIKVRKRSCNNPAPKHNGRTCVGNNQQEIYCTDLPPCPQVTPTLVQIDGQWSHWSEWSKCSASCGKGFRIRERKCNNPAPQNGLDCIGCNVEYEECNKQPCTEVKKHGPWTQWLVMNNSSESGYLEKRYRFMCKAHTADPSDLKISLFKEETRMCKKNDNVCQRVHLPNKAAWGCWTDWSPCSVTSGAGRRVRYRKCLSSNGDILEDKECGNGPSVEDEICNTTNCEDSRYDNSSGKKENFDSTQDEKILSSSLGLHWIFIIIILFTAMCCFITFYITKIIVEKRVYRASTMGSPHYLTSFPNQYSSLPTKDYIDNNRAKRQPSFSGSTSRSKVPNSQGTLTKSNNNLLNQNTPKILKYQNDTDNGTLKRNSALNNMRLKQIEDDNDKY